MRQVKVICAEDAEFEQQLNEWFSDWTDPSNNPVRISSIDLLQDYIY
jgi:hypothetical protein